MDQVLLLTTVYHTGSTENLGSANDFYAVGQMYSRSTQAGIFYVTVWGISTTQTSNGGSLNYHSLFDTNSNGGKALEDIGVRDLRMVHFSNTILWVLG